MKFEYKAQGELNSQYLLDLINEYFSKMLEVNDTKGIDENGYNINVKGSYFAQGFKDNFNRLRLKLKGSDLVTDNYNKKVSTLYINNVLEKLQIFLQTNVLSAKEIFDINQMLKSIHFDMILPVIEECRVGAIYRSEKAFLKVLKDIKHLGYSNSEYVLFNSPVTELKPFLSEKVSIHKADVRDMSTLIKHFVNVRNCELNNFNKFKETEIDLPHDIKEFYDDEITDNGVGEEVEAYIRSKMQEKLEIDAQEDVLAEDRLEDMAVIDALLKRLGVYKIEQLMEQLASLKCDQANAKDIMEKCKEMLNKSTISSKDQIFLAMDRQYYKLSNKCEKLQAKIKLKLQLVDKQKMFALADKLMEDETYKINKRTTELDNHSVREESVLGTTSLQEKLTKFRSQLNKASAGQPTSLNERLTSIKVEAQEKQTFTSNEAPGTQLSQDKQTVEKASNLTESAPSLDTDVQEDDTKTRLYNADLYEDDEDDEIHISEDDTDEDLPESEIVIEDEDDDL